MSPCRPAISSMSLGRAFASHSLPHKLSCAAQEGFRGIEIFYEDLEYFAREQEPFSKPDETPSEAQLLKAASLVKSICEQNQQVVLGLQPFLFYEGLVDRTEHRKLIQKLHLWFKLAAAMGTDVIQIPTQFRKDTETTGDMEIIVQDMIEVADLGLKEDPPIKFAYENLAWGNFLDTWDGIWEVVKRVDRWNFGLCLDTFNIAGRVWADPVAPDGTTGSNADKDLQESMARMVSQVDLKKVWYVQVVGAERMRSPLVKGHDWHVENQPARMSWSRNARLFYGEEDLGQYLPIQIVSKALLDPVDKGGLGYEGWVSMELFSRSMNDTAKDVPEQHAKRAAVAWGKLKADLQLE